MENRRAGVDEGRVVGHGFAKRFAGIPARRISRTVATSRSRLDRLRPCESATPRSRAQFAIPAGSLRRATRRTRSLAHSSPALPTRTDRNHVRRQEQRAPAAAPDRCRRRDAQARRKDLRARGCAGPGTSSKYGKTTRNRPIPQDLRQPLQLAPRRPEPARTAPPRDSPRSRRIGETGARSRRGPG